MADTQKPSFFSSVVDGIGGYGKGFFGGALLGVGVGVLVGIAALAIPGGIVIGGATLAGTTLVAFFTAATSSLFASVGGIAGIVTNVVKGRETPQPTAQEIAHMAQTSFAKGVNVGHQTALAQVEETTKFRDKINQERAQAATAQKTVH